MKRSRKMSNKTYSNGIYILYLQTHFTFEVVKDLIFSLEEKDIDDSITEQILMNSKMMDATI